ncbi:MAG: LptF/LptG family permease [Daejeonella sp.]
MFKAFIRPFIVTFFIVMFILLMLFLFKYIDDLIGKGFDWYVIMELLFYASATNVAMALPLAILLSSIMTFGSLGENYELVAIKSAGISLQRAMMPLVIVVCMLSTGAFFFSDYMLPVANLKMGSLLYDVRNQKASFLIDEGVFNNSISGYAIRVKKKDADGQTLHNIVIYDHNTSNGNMSVLLAKEGRMYRSSDEQFLVLKLKDGIRYVEQAGNSGQYNPRQVFMRIRFKETEQKFDLSAFKLQRTDENLFKSNYAMLNLKQLTYYRDSIKQQIDSNLKTTFTAIKPFYKEHKSPAKPKDAQLKNPGKFKDVLQLLPEDRKMSAIQAAKSQIRAIKQVLADKEVFNTDYKGKVRSFSVEFHRKFTLPLSCILLFFIGAPLGAIIRKGGLGLPVVMSVLFFLIFHITSTIGEKSAKEGTLSPFFGMWLALITLTPLGIFLTYKATVDSVLFDLDSYKAWFIKLLPKKNKLKF